MGEKKKESGQERSNPHRRDGGGDGGSDGRKASGKGYLPQYIF